MKMPEQVVHAHERADDSGADIVLRQQDGDLVVVEVPGRLLAKSARAMKNVIFAVGQFRLPVSGGHAILL
jgi:HJR/Mrr/RecB family endonuclease